MTTTGTMKELEDHLAIQRKIVADGMELGVKVDGENVQLSQDVADKIKAAYDKGQEIKSFIQYMQFGAGNLGVADGIDIKAMQESAAMAAQAQAREGVFAQKSLAQMFTDSPEFKAMRAAKQFKMDTPFNVEAYDLSASGRGQKDVFNAMNTGSITRTFGSIQFDPMVPRGQLRNRVRDLFPVAATSANLIDFFQVLGFASGTVDGRANSGNAAMVPDRASGAFGLKPQSPLQFRSNQAPVRTIAHWEAVHRNALDDEPQLQSVINNELLYGLALQEDHQILKGSGNGDELLGILNQPFIQDYNGNATTGELFSDSLRRAATLAIIANYPATGYVLHPNDWEHIEIQKASGDGQYMLFSNISVGASSTVWRQPVVETPAIDQGTFLTGAFGTAAQLYDRQQANIRIAEQHSDYFIRNAIVVLAEERLALAVKRPEAFIRGRFNGTASLPADEDSNPAT